MESTEKWNIVTKYLNLIEDYTTLYHYTNVYGLEGIIKHRELWVSNADFLNDKTERKYTEEILFNLIEDKSKNHNLRDFIIMGMEEILDMKNYATYVLSLSKNKDSNLLWSNYSKDDGYNISFQFESLKDIVDSPDLTVFKSKVIYDEKIHYEALNKLADFCIATFTNTKTNSEEFLDEIRVILTSLQLLSSFSKIRVFNKRKSIE